MEQQPDKDGFYNIMLFDGTRVNRAGYRYDNVAAKINEAITKKGHLPVHYGSPSIGALDTFDISNLCGHLTHPFFLEESSSIGAVFQPSGAYGQYAINMLEANSPESFSIRSIGKDPSPKFGIRAQGTRNAAGEFSIDRLISIDLLPE